jgi:hypothetical protein
MTILLSTLAVAFAAFCVWLTVRVVNRKERWAKWTLAGMVGVPVLYVASFGPVCWINARRGTAPVLPRIYLPIGWAMKHSEIIAKTVLSYGGIGMKSGEAVLVPIGHAPNGETVHLPVFGR